MWTGYQVRSVLHPGPVHQILRALRTADGTPVVLKHLAGIPLPQRLERLRHEFEVTQRVPGPGILRPLALEGADAETGPVLVFPDLLAQSLRQWQGGAPVEPAEVVDIALALAKVLGRVHAAGFRHGDVNPANVLRVFVSHEILLCDFGLATRIDSLALQQGALQGTLAYIAPEQTGRTSRAPDHRSDLYSLGATLYELLIGQPPFDSADPLALVHAHLATRPLSPKNRRSAVPASLSDLVLKLLAKNPEDRYQSAFGLAQDLLCIQTELQKTGEASAFALGQKDVAARFELRPGLYGREAESAVLQAAYGRVVGGSTESLMIRGPSGVGKSALVEELRRHVTAKGGLFLSGKYDQFRRNIPLSGLAQAAEALARRLLAESPERLLQWMQALQRAVGNLGQVLLQLCPLFERVLGAQPSLPELGPVETERRLNRVVGNLLEVIATQEHPLVLFLDDLQWADGASLRLLETLLTSEARPYFLLLGAYRDAEVEAGHPLSAVLAAMSKAGARVDSLLLGALPLEAVKALVAAALWAHPDKVHALSAVIHEKTGGTPFYVGEFLRMLAQRELLRFDPEQGVWTWELEALLRQSVTENVASLLAQRFQTQGERTRQMLAQAACLGTTFPLSFLAQGTGEVPEQLAQDLAPAIGAGLLRVEGSDANGGLAAGLSSETQLSFQHDRVQQAAYESLSEAERPVVHQRLGQRLQQGTEAELEQRLFDVVRHLNAGAALLSSVSERLELASLNLRAARKARASAAHEPARRLLDMALSLLPGNRWSSAYELTLEVHLERAQTAVALSLFDEVLQTRDQVLRAARTPLARARMLELVVRSFAIQGNTDDAIDTGIQALHELGISLPKHPFPPSLFVIVAQVRILRGKRTLEQLRTSPLVTDPAIQIALRILAALLITTATTRPLLMPFILFTMLGLTFRHGRAPQAAAAYAVYGLILSALGDFAGGVSFESLALRLLESFPEEVSRGWVMALAAGSTYSLHQPLRACLRLYKLAALAARDAGEVEGDGFASACSVYISFLVGMPLDEQRQLDQAALQNAEKLQHVFARFMIVPFLHAVERLSARPSSEAAESQALLRIELQRELEQRQARTALAFFWGIQGVESVLRAEPQEAASCFAAYGRHRHALWGTLAVPVLDSYTALTMMALYPRLPLVERVAARAKLLRILIGLRKRARFAPQNYAHLERLLTAEWSRTSGANPTTTKAQYQQAIELARTHGFLHEEALSQELYSRFLAAHGDEVSARIARQAAYRLYQTWGAQAILARLEASFPELRPQPVPASASASASVDSMQLDLTAVLRAAQALSGEIVIAKLLSILLRTLLEAAGAARGVLLLRDGEVLVLAAQATSGDKEVALPAPIPLSKDAPLALALIRYVERSGEEIILEHSLKDLRFASDPYLQSRPPCALLALPLIRQGTLTGLLYLENDLTSGAFTSARIQVVRLLASQAAISLENAKLYAAQQAYAQTLEQQVQARTHDLREALSRLHTELSDAASYIRARLPPPIPDGGRIAADWLFVPSLELGGDAFDYFFVDEHRFVLYLLDVAGHGVGPSLLAISVLRCLREQGLPEVDLCNPPAVCQALNQRFSSEAYGGRYFTLFYAVMDLRTRTLRYVQAGHPPALLQSAATHQLLTSDRAMMGPVDGLEYQAAECQVEPGSRLYGFSDGAYEVMSPERTMLPFERFCAELLRDPPAQVPRTQVLARMLALSQSHHGAQTLPDDFSFLAFDFPPLGP